MRNKSRFFALAALAVTGCSQAGNQDTLTDVDASTNVAVPERQAADSPKPVNMPQPTTTPPPEAPAPEATFPAALHGRWGLVPADCTSTRGDAKGLVTITAKEVRFYESVARPAKIVERTNRVIRGEFDFTGEGMEWTNYMTWSVDGDSLTRVDSEEDSRLVYARCR